MLGLIAPGAYAYLYFVVLNAYDTQTGGPSNTGFRVEIFELDACRRMRESRLY